jgi:radical SAM superfamily enzyme YgiQ (UPF0313 family)
MCGTRGLENYQTVRILLINPSGKNMLRGNNPAFLDETRGCNPPLGLGYIASSILNHTRHYVNIHDMQIRNDLDFELSFNNYDIVGITATSFVMPEVVEVIQAIKRYSPTSKIILGGVHPTLYPEETLHLGVDCVIQGEGEYGFLDMINEVFDRTNIIHKAELIKDIDKLPIPLRLDIEKYNSIFSDGFATTIITSRGCPYSCRFCYRPVFGKTIRYRSPENVIDEIKECYKKGIKNFLFYDDTFTIDKERAYRISELILINKLKIKFDIRSRVNTLDYSLLKILKKAGLIQIHLGVESGNQKVLDAMQKGIKKEEIEGAFRLCKSLRIKTLAYIMIGCPEETKLDVVDTINFIRKIKPDYLHGTIFVPFPGTSFYHEWMILKKVDPWQFFARNPIQKFIPPVWGDIPKEDLESILDNIYRSFYLRPSYIIKKTFEIRTFERLKKYIKAGLNLLKK